MMQEITFDELPKAEQDLLVAANEAANKAYAPYSGTLVGSAVRTCDDEIIAGVNFEYAPFDSICAERVALLNAHSQGAKTVQTIALYIKKMHSEHTDPPIPCAKCRIMILQFQKRAGKVIDLISACPNMKTVYKFTVEDTMP